MSAYRANEPRISEDIKKTLKLPLGIDPITIIPLGYPDEVPDPKAIKPLNEVVSYEHFNKK